MVSVNNKSNFQTNLTHALLVGKNCTFCLWNCLELLAVFHEKIKTNINLISIKLMHLKNISIIIKTVLYSSFEFENFVESQSSQ